MAVETINWALVGVVVIIGGCTWKGKQNGFIKAAFSAFSTILSIIGAIILGPVVRNMFPESSIFSYVVAFIIASVGLAIVCNVLDIVAKLPVLHQINQAAGLLMGLVQGVLSVWILFVILDLFGSTVWGSTVLSMIHSSVLTNALYENNLLYRIWNIL